MIAKQFVPMLTNTGKRENDRNATQKSSHRLHADSPFPVLIPGQQTFVAMLENPTTRRVGEAALATGDALVQQHLHLDSAVLRSPFFGFVRRC